MSKKYEELLFKDIKDTWKNRKLSWLIKCLINNSESNLNELAECLGISKTYLNNKLTRNSFSFEEILIAIYLSKKRIVILDGNKIYAEFNPLSWFSEDDDMLKRIKNCELNKRMKIIEEYNAKKAELEEMKIKYGLE